MKITESLEAYIKRTTVGDWNEENAAWIYGMEKATKYGYHTLVEKLIEHDKINEISDEIKEKLIMNAVRSDSSDTLKKLLSCWKRYLHKLWWRHSREEWQMSLPAWRQTTRKLMRRKRKQCRGQ